MRMHTTSFTLFQYGFLKLRSCETQLTQFITDIYFNNGLSGAFDTVSHSLLVHYFHNYRIEGSVNSMTQAVIFEGKK